MTTDDVYSALNTDTTLTAVATSTASIDLAWSSTSSPYTGVEIQRCSGAGCTDFKSVFGSPFTGVKTQHSEAGLTSGTKYRFRVRSINATTSAPWLTSNDTTTLADVQTPTGYTLSSLGDTSITIAWTDNSSSELFYDVYRCSGASCSTFTAASNSPISANATTYTDTNLVADTYYTYRVRATGTAGSSAWLTGTEVRSGPNAPTALTTGTTTSTSIALSWTNNATTQTSYEAQKCTGSGCTTFAAVSAAALGAGATSVTESGLTGSTTYRFRVRAVRSGIGSDWLTSSDITTKAAAASCASPNTYVIDKGVKAASTNVGRGLWSDTKVIPGTRQPAVAYYDGSATGGTMSLKVAYWDGSTWQVESAAGDNRVVAATNAVFVRLAFLSTGVPMVFWVTGSTTVKAAVRSTAFGTTGTWSAAVIDTVAGATNRALEVSVNPMDQVGLVYLTTNVAATGRARFIYCSGTCTTLSNFVAMTAGSDTIESSNSIINTVATGIAWCRHNSTTYYPAVVYPGNGGAAIRYASCLGALSTCKTVAGWSGQQTTVVSTAGTMAKLYLDPTFSDTPKILTRNAGNTLLQVFEMNKACNLANSGPAYSFTAGNTFGAANSGNAWATLLKSSNGFWHVLTNLSTTNINYHNSVTTTFSTTTWNTAGTVDTITLPAGGAGGGGADVNNTDNQIYTSYGGSTTPFTLNLGVVADHTVTSSAGTAVYYALTPDSTGGIQFNQSTGTTRNVATATTSAGKPGVVYVDFSIGAVAGATLKYAYRNGTTAATTWTTITLPNTGTPSAPSLAFDHNNKPWIGFYDASNLKYFLATNSATDGSGTWNFYQFPSNGKTTAAALPATEDTAVVMYYSGGAAKPVMLTLNSSAAGSPGVRSAFFDTSALAFTSVTTLDALTAASYGTRLTADFDTSGNIVVAYYDFTATRVKFNYSTNGTTWLGTPPQISAANQGREGLSIHLDPSTSRPAVSYYDRANNNVYFNYCTKAMSLCSLATNWTTATVASSVGVSGIGTANEALLNTTLTYSADGVPHVSYMSGIAATTQQLGLANNSTGSFVTTALTTRPSSRVTGASAFNFDMAGLNESSVRNTLGHYLSAYIGPNNWLYATSCGD